MSISMPKRQVYVAFEEIHSGIFLIRVGRFFLKHFGDIISQTAQLSTYGKNPSTLSNAFS